ncbi:hypothetical protein Tco_1526492, partial [Tanacetum coccineum]
TLIISSDQLFRCLGPSIGASKGLGPSTGASKATGLTYNGNEVYVQADKSITRNRAFGKVYDEVYREELCKVEELIRDRRRAEAELFFESGQELTEAIRKTWTDEMLDIYRACMDENIRQRRKITIKNHQYAT